LIDVQTAEALLKENPLPIKTTVVPLEQAFGKTLAQDISADRPFPPFNRVAMDGYAFAFVDRSHPLKIVGEAPAGSPQTSLAGPQTCLAVMTGAILPAGCDTVVKKEDINLEDGHIIISDPNLKCGMHIHVVGSDAAAGQILLLAGTKIQAKEMAILATVGQVHLKVAAPLRIHLISSGNEVVPPSQTPLPYQIRSSNAILLASYLQSYGHTVFSDHIQDNIEAVILATEAAIIQQADLLIFTGGVSVGKYDFIIPGLAAAGVNQIFHGISQRPGKPLYFGRKNNLFCVGLPGNPSSTLTCFLRYVLPWLGGFKHRPRAAVLSADIAFGAPLTFFQTVAIENRLGVSYAIPIKTGGSGDMVSVLHATGFIELPKGQDIFKAGQVFDYYSFE
jgi:molybdopterin molybdotransferase